MKFKSYLQTEDVRTTAEATKAITEDFSLGNLKKVGTLITKMAAKKIGAGKFTYIYDENFKKADGQVGIGSVFISDKGVIMRFNYLSNAKKGFSVNSIDYWKGRKIGDIPNKSISFAGENIVRVTDQLFAYLKDGLVESFDDEKFMTFDLLETSVKERKQQRLVFAQNYGIKAGYADGASGLRKAAVRAGVEDEFDKEFGGTISVSTDVKETTSTQDKFAVSDGMFQDPNYYADPKYVFDDIEEAAKVLAEGRWRSLIVAGMGGIGKTFGIKKVLTEKLGEYGEGPRGKWAFYEGLSTTGFGLFKLLLLNKRKLIVFDDSDAIWKDKDMINMMKIVTSDSGDRTITWASNSTANVALMSKSQREDYELEYIQEIMDDPNTKMKPPSTFNFEGQMINISNLPAGKFDDAIKSRAIFINVYLAQRDVLRRMATIKKMQGASDAKIERLLTMLDPNAMDALKGIGTYGGEVKYVTPEISRKNKIMNMRSLDIAEALYDANVKNLDHMVSLYA